VRTWVCPRAPRDSLCSCASACSASAGQTTRLSRPRLQSNKPLAPAQGLLGTVRRCRLEVQPAAVRSRCSLQVRSQSGSSWSGGRAARVARGVCDAGAEEVGAAPSPVALGTPEATPCVPPSLCGARKHSTQLLLCHVRAAPRAARTRRVSPARQDRRELTLLRSRPSLPRLHTAARPAKQGGSQDAAWLDAATTLDDLYDLVKRYAPSRSAPGRAQQGRCAQGNADHRRSHGSPPLRVALIPPVCLRTAAGRIRTSCRPCRRPPVTSCVSCLRHWVCRAFTRC